jgi:uncharacterized membrane protein YeiH
MDRPSPQPNPVGTAATRLLSALDLAGIFVFALQGAIAAAQQDLDLLGLVLVAFVTGLGGGIIRDVLIGDVPPPGIHDWRYGTTAGLAALTVFFGYQSVTDISPPVLVTIDAVGLALFAVAGATKALNFGMSAAMGALSGVGGGVIRDLLLSRVPQILKSDIYALAAYAGAVVVVLGSRAKVSPALTGIIAALVCFAFRMASYHYHWQLPHVR